MRFDTKVIFCTEPKKEYDPKTGDYVKGECEQEIRYASVTDSGTERVMLHYGKLVNGAKIVRIQGHISRKYVCLVIGNKTYEIDRNIRFRRFEALSVHEVSA